MNHHQACQDAGDAITLLWHGVLPKMSTHFDISSRALPSTSALQAIAIAILPLLIVVSCTSHNRDHPPLEGKPHQPPLPVPITMKKKGKQEVQRREGDRSTTHASPWGNPGPGHGVPRKRRNRPEPTHSRQRPAAHTSQVPWTGHGTWLMCAAASASGGGPLVGGMTCRNNECKCCRKALTLVTDGTCCLMARLCCGCVQFPLASFVAITLLYIYLSFLFITLIRIADGAPHYDSSFLAHLWPDCWPLIQVLFPAKLPMPPPVVPPRPPQKCPLQCWQEAAPQDNDTSMAWQW